VLNAAKALRRLSNKFDETSRPAIFRTLVEDCSKWSIQVASELRTEDFWKKYMSMPLRLGILGKLLPQLRKKRTRRVSIFLLRLGNDISPTVMAPDCRIWRARALYRQEWNTGGSWLEEGSLWLPYIKAPVLQTWTNTAGSMDNILSSHTKSRQHSHIEKRLLHLWRKASSAL